MTRLVLGPMLRYVGERDASIWVETADACEVAITAGSVSVRERTFRVAGHHYAIAVLAGFEPGASTPYEVRLDGQLVWPTPESPFPPSRIRTIDPGKPVQLLFGSCREPPSGSILRQRRRDPDVLNAFADRMLSQHPDQWPDVLLLVGDQIYADETSKPMQQLIRSRRDIRRPPGSEVADFEEYAQLYRETWSEPTTRWLLSTVPSAMIFDDHEIRDDWNTSEAWREDMQRTDWWEDRISGGLMSYWIYQHIGNLSPARLADDETLRAVRATADAQTVLRQFALAADREVDGRKGTMWSYRRDFGRIRVLVVDSRCGRILADGRRSMISDAEFEWLERQAADGDYDHLAVVTSMPWLLPRALHDIESWNEALCAGARGRVMGRLAEKVRRALDLEHWAAFRRSFDRLAALFAGVGNGADGREPPATITVLSGDVHHSYVAEVRYPESVRSRVYQFTCSPIQNSIPFVMRVVFSIGWSRTMERALRLLDRVTRVAPMVISWHHPTGPHWGNMLTSLTFDARSASAVLERSVSRATSPSPRSGPSRGSPPPARDGTAADLEIVAELVLTGPRRTSRRRGAG